jgi:TPP-dependent pyruvate/acetoin dehydrogenase alpha subunit
MKSGPSAVQEAELPTYAVTLSDFTSLYRRMRLIRRVEEEIARVYPSDKIKSPVHLSIGQEAVSVGVCDVLRPDDIVSPTYRCHAAYLAKGGDLKAMLAELFGKESGCARGKGGSMHLVDMEHCILGASAVVGTSIAVAVGYALALKMEQRSRVAAIFFGDGATEEGVFHESLNFAALHRLPILFVCENNGYAIHTPLSKRWATQQLCERVRTYGIPAQAIPDSSILEIRRLTAEYLSRIRAGAGPAFLECRTYRWREHVGPEEDYDSGYRTREELQPWLENDQLAVIGTQIDPALLKRIDAEVEYEVAEAFIFAEMAPWPNPQELYRNVYAE